MIISGKQVQNIVKTYGDQSKVTKSSNTGKVSPSQQKDQVILSTSAQEFGHLLQKVKDMPEVREDLVNRISEKVSGGTYNIDGSVVAEKMIGRTLADNPR